jgi:hypothetical protein
MSAAAVVALFARNISSTLADEGVWKSKQSSAFEKECTVQQSWSLLSTILP